MDLCEAARQRSATILLMLDQFEELLSSDSPEATDFLHLLCGVLTVGEQPLMAMFTLRSDFLAEFQEHPVARGLVFESLPISSMSVDQLVKIIEGPADKAGIHMEPSLAIRMVKDTETEDALPLLAFTLRKLYERYRAERLFTIAQYFELGGIASSVAEAAEAAYVGARLSKQKAADLRNAFIRMVRISDAGRHTRKAVLWRDLPETVHSVLERFVQSRLLVSSGENGERTLEVAHEALFRSRIRLKEWLIKDHGFLLWRNRLRDFVKDREHIGDDALLRGAQLQEAQNWYTERGTELSPEERKFIEQSSVSYEREQQQWKRLFEQAESQRRIAVSQYLATSSMNRPRDELELPILLAVAALRLDDNPRSREALFNALERCPLLSSTFVLRAQGERNLSHCVLSPNGNLCAIADRYCIEIWDIAQHRQIRTIHEESLEALAWSPDGHRLAAISYDGKVRMLEIDQARFDQDLVRNQKSRNNSNVPRAISWSPDGKRLAVGGPRGEVLVWSVKSGKLLRRLDAHKSIVSGLAWSPDGRLLATGDASIDKAVNVWRWRTGERLLWLQDYDSTLSSLVWSPDGTSLVWGRYSREANITLATLEENESHLFAKISSLEGHKVVSTIIAWRRDGKAFASSGGDGFIKLWDSKRREVVFTLLKGEGAATQLTWNESPLELKLASNRGTVKVWNLTAVGLIQELAKIGRGVSALSWNPLGEQVAVSSREGKIALLELGSGDVSRVLSFDGVDSISELAWSPDGSKLAIAGGWSNTVIVYDSASSQIILKLAGHNDYVSAVAWSPDRLKVASASFDNQVKIWDADNGTLLSIFKHENYVMSLSWSPDGKQLASASEDKTIRIWNPQGLLTTLSRQDSKWGDFSIVRWCPVGSTLVSASQYRNDFALWDTDSGQLINVVEGHESPILSLAWSYNGKLVASSCIDGTINLWQMDSGKLVQTLRHRGKQAQHLAWHPTSIRLVGASSDGTLELFNVDSKHWLDRAEKMVGRNLTEEEWRFYVSGSSPYMKVFSSLP
jgi:WD40 repeat protein